MTREEFYIKIDQLAEEYSGVEKVLKLMELLTKYIVPLEQRNTELEKRVKELEEPKTCEGCQWYHKDTHDRCQSPYYNCVRNNHLMDRYQPKDTK